MLEILDSFYPILALKNYENIDSTLQIIKQKKLHEKNLETGKKIVINTNVSVRTKTGKKKAHGGYSDEDSGGDYNEYEHFDGMMDLNARKVKKRK